MASVRPSRVLALLAALGCFSCLGAGATSPPLAPLLAGGHHVLFIGNSLTYVNDLPATVAAIAQSAGDTIRVATEAQPNLALIDQLNGGSRAVDHIAVGGWEYVVLQQGPTPRGICRDSLILFRAGTVTNFTASSVGWNFAAGSSGNIPLEGGVVLTGQKLGSLTP